MGAPKFKIAAKNRRSFIKILKPQAVHIQAYMHPYTIQAKKQA
jgi:hypothetical protein